MEQNSVFYGRFIDSCAAIGKKPSQVARECGLSKATVSGWKRNGSLPTDTNMARISRSLHVSQDWLSGRADKCGYCRTSKYSTSSLISEVGAGIRSLRISRGFSQQQLSGLVDFRDSDLIAKAESGEIDLSLSTLEKIAKVLNVPPDYIISCGKRNDEAKIFMLKQMR